MARELVSRIQTLRKESGFDVTDRIELLIQRNGNAQFEQAMTDHALHIAAETLAVPPDGQLLVNDLPDTGSGVHTLELEQGLSCSLWLSRIGRLSAGIHYIRGS